MPYADELKYAIQIAQSVAREHHNEFFSGAHLLYGVLHNDVGLASWLSMLHKDIHYCRDWAEVRVEEVPKAARTPETIQGDKSVKSVIELAELISLQFSKANTDPWCVLAALLKPGLSFTAEQLKSFPVTQKEIFDAGVEETAIRKAVGIEESAPKAVGSVKSDAISKYCSDRLFMARDGKSDPIVGRDREIRMMMEVLGRRTKPNVILVGEPGVGKTALVDGFAQRIVDKRVPEYLLEAQLFELDSGALVAGASYKGEVEDRLKGILKEIKQFDKAILFVDEMHLLLDSKGSMGSGVANLLKPELARGEITLIGATTIDEYRQFIEKDEAFSRRFEIVRVEEPDVTTAIRMIQRLLPLYETHHQIKVHEEAAAEAVRLSKRYVKDRRLPDAAIDLLDRTMASIHIMDETAGEEIERLDAQLEAILSNGQVTEENDLMAELSWFEKEMKDKVSEILLTQLESNVNEGEQERAMDSSQMQIHLRSSLSALKKLTESKKDFIDKNDIASIVSFKTGIPLGKIQTKERDKLLSIGDMLKKRVIGQDQAIKALSEAILESRSGLIKAGQPIGSFFLLGPTGTGKTELAKALSEFLFNDENFLVRFDMSEFKEEHSAALLYGAPPGYVGYEEGGLLVNKIREKPYSVVLFDEIEKAHPSVFDIFLQILDEGKLHDRLGKEGDFSNAVILFTSNIGSERVAQKFESGEVPSTSELMDVMAGHFRPEFLARLTEIVPFAPISETNAVQIFNIHLKSLTDPLAKQGIALHISETAKKHLALNGFNSRYGARPLKGIIRNQLRKPISKMIISGELSKGSTLSIDMDEEDKLVWEVNSSVLVENV